MTAPKTPLVARSLRLLPAVVLMASVPLPARADDALDELKEGYALKKSGHCREAIPRFLASYRLDRRPKALLNLADCESQVGELLAAREHAAEGRELARQQHESELAAVADAQLATLEQKTPRLTLRLTPLAADPAAGTQITLDGTSVDASSLGTPLALNPGPHRITATAPGRADREIDLTLGEGARQEVNVQAGTSLATPGVAAPSPGPASDAPLESRPEPAPRSADASSGTRRAMTYGVIGLGAAGLTVGIGLGLAAVSKHGALEQACPANRCGRAEQGDLDAFHAFRTVSAIGYVVGAAALAGGVVLWLTTPSGSPGVSARVVVSPASAGVSGSF